MNETSEHHFTLGDYFESVSTFLIHQGMNHILAYASKILGQNISKNSIEQLGVRLEKHGEFYHPSRIHTEINGKKFSFVLNVAISKPGNSLIKREFGLLKHLNEKYRQSFLPEVFCLGGLGTKNNQKVSMFLGEWFEDFDEFHISYDAEAGVNRIMVWAEDGNFFLSSEETAKLYCQAAKILTLYYAVDTCEQILSWHHAAGDFVINIMDNDVCLKLISVRNYASMFRYREEFNADDGSETMLDALLIFFLNMSIRMRLDRLNGVGDMVWSDTIAVENCLLGFYEGLKLKYCEGLQRGFADAYVNDYLSKYGIAELYELSSSIADRFYQNINEIELIQSHLNEHIQALYASIQFFVQSNKKAT